MYRLALILALVIVGIVPASYAQKTPVFQSGSISHGRASYWITNGVIGDAGPAASGNVTELGITNTGTPFCIADTLTTSNHQFCLGALSLGGGLMNYQANGGASSLPFTVNTSGPLILSSAINDIRAENLPVGGTGTAQMCANPTSGILSIAADGANCGGGGGGGDGFPITIGSTSIAASSTTPALSGLTLNGGTLNGTFSGFPTFGSLALTGNLTTNITGSTQCVHANSAGVLSGTGSDCGSGGGGLPMLTNGQVLGNATGSTTTATATNLVAGSGITITATGGNLTIGASGSGGVSGPGSSANGAVPVWNGTAGNALNDSGVLFSSLVQNSRTVSTSAPLTGGGNLASNLTLGITIPNTSLLGGTGTAFTSIGLGGCLSITSSTLNNTCAGTVTSVGLTMPTIFSVSGTPIISAGAFTVSLVSQAANTAFLSPNGSSGAPAFRSIAYADLPTAVSSGSCTTCNVTFNAQGIATSFSNGSASTPVIFTGTTAGTANAQTMASPTPSGFAFTNQFIVRFLVGAGLTNTGAATLSVNGTTAEPVEVQSGTALSALTGGELQAGFEYDAVANTSCTCYVLTTIIGTPIINNATSATITQAQWKAGAIFNVTSGGQTFTLPVATSLSPGGGITINTVGVSATIAPNAADGINGGSIGSSVTVSSGVQASVFTVGSSGTGAFTANPLTNSSISGLTTNTIPKATSSTAIGNSSVTDNGTVVNTTEPIEFGGAKLPTFFLPTASWVAGQNPNNAIIVADLPAAITLFSAAARIEVPVGATATISLFSAPSGTACSAGTNLASATSINANGTAATNQLLTLTTTSVAAGSSLCLQTTGSGNWTTGSGVGAITIGYNPT